MTSEIDKILQSQRSYYDATVDFVARTSAFAETTDIDRIEHALVDVTRGQHVIDIGCGRGDWTARYATRAATVTALDVSGPRLAACRQRLGTAVTSYLLGDFFAVNIDTRFHCAVLTFVLSHVPSSHLDRLWTRIGGLLTPGGNAFLIDHRPNHASVGVVDPVETREVPDGRSFQVFKVLRTLEEVRDDLRERGWHPSLYAVGTGLFYGVVRAPEAP